MSILSLIEQFFRFFLQNDVNSENVVMHLESKFTMSLVFATTFFFVGGGGRSFVTWLSRPILSLKFLDPWAQGLIAGHAIDRGPSYCPPFSTEYRIKFYLDKNLTN